MNTNRIENPPKIWNVRSFADRIMASQPDKDGKLTLASLLDYKVTFDVENDDLTIWSNLEKHDEYWMFSFDVKFKYKFDPYIDNYGYSDITQSWYADSDVVTGELYVYDIVLHEDNECTAEERKLVEYFAKQVFEGACVDSEYLIEGEYLHTFDELEYK